MSYEAFMETVVTEDEPNPGLSEILKALWWCAKGDWDAAHNIVQDIDDADGSWVHAHLHRVEGDLGNAGYWYNRANQPMCRDSLEAERAALISHFLERMSD